jgi:hypothetical protein
VSIGATCPLCWLLWSHTTLLSLREIAFRDIAIPVAKFTGLPPTKSRNRNPLANPTVLVAWIYGPIPPELRTIRSTRGRFPTPPWDLMTHGTLRILHREFRPFVLPLRICPPVVPRYYAFLQSFKELGRSPSFDPFEGPNPYDLSTTSGPSENSCSHSLWQPSNTFKCLNFLRFCAHLQQQSLNTSLRSTTLRLHSAYALLTRLLCPTALLWK